MVSLVPSPMALPPFLTVSVIGNPARRVQLMTNGETRIFNNILPKAVIHDRLYAFCRYVMDPICRDEDVTMVVICNGGVRFYVELTQCISEGCSDELMCVPARSYGIERRSSEVLVSETMIVPSKIRGRTVVVLDDILETGRTVAEVIRLLEKHEPKRIITAFLLRKQDTQTALVHPDYCLFEVHRDSWVFGYGMDLAEKYRRLSFICDANEHLYDRNGMPLY